MSGSPRSSVNGWRCRGCDAITWIVHVDDGVTPMFLGCRATRGCVELATSLMYPETIAGDVLSSIEWEWYRPSRRQRRKLSPELREHVDKGGLNLRPITKAGRAALAERA